MSKVKTSIACIECGDKLLKSIYPIFLEYKNNVDRLSNIEKETYNTLIGPQFALACEYYLKGLLIPNIKITIPNELKSKIGLLTEEQELMIIVADLEKMKCDKVLGSLDKKELRLLLNENSLKSFVHNLSSLLGTRTLEENKEIFLPKIVRESIISKLKSLIVNVNATTCEEKRNSIEYLNSTVDGTKGANRLSNSDIIVEKAISSSTVNDAFPRGRYGIFDGFVSDIDWISGLLISIRQGIKLQYPNLIEVFKNKGDNFGKFIYPDINSSIKIEYTNELIEEYETVPSLYTSISGQVVFWNALKSNEYVASKKMSESLDEYLDLYSSANQKIYLENFSCSSIEFKMDNQIKILEVINDNLTEIIPEKSKKYENENNIQRKRY